MKKEQETENNKTEEKKGDMRKEVVSWVRMFVIVIAVVFVLTQFVIINVRVPSGSMENTIMTKDRLIGFRFSYWFDEPQRGDIILFSYPVDEKQTYIKRVIGLPGETVEIRDGKIYIDGSSEPLEEDYLKETWTWENDGYTFKVPEGCYFVLGDNRNDSEDGRFWAQIALNEGKASTPEEAEPYSYVKKDEIKGKAIFKYYSKFAILTNK
ncbi:MAG: signal peptidase I [Eubacterium ramulus]|jgi:signal peptidase I|uniref:Signal peptidase I n=1 Tax=Eubacterium ramulus TaxID=39490 RepID=A0A2V1JXC3_EUBRA|nr:MULTISPECIES: signal peptidase I [Clostridia]PWE88033.1 signal peptidase [Eubacterium ramulus]RHV71143.1 signal peptidase I [Roseburia sp. OM02-15]